MDEKEKLMTETTAILAKNPRLWFGGEGKNEDHVHRQKTLEMTM